VRQVVCVSHARIIFTTVPQFFTADFVHNGHVYLPKGTAVGIDEQGKIIAIGNAVQEKVQHLSGLLCPGFVNAHCHLELSDMLGKIPMHTGLVAFLQQVNAFYKHRNDSDAIAAAQAQDAVMYQRGIAAVGDICNTSFSMRAKNNSRIAYRNFIEVFGAVPQAAPQRMQAAKALLQQFLDSGFSNTSITPHAVYSISNALWQVIDAHLQNETLVSIHNQESAAEDALIKAASGEFINFLAQISTDIPVAMAHHVSALQYHAQQLSNCQHVLLVHNTFSSEEDIAFAQQRYKSRTWCVCPMANHYIEKHINPLYAHLHAINENVCIGTDSLASNTQLCMLTEMQMFQQYYPHISAEILLKWATSNGAKALRFKHLGEIAIGTTPGLVHIDTWQESHIPATATINRIA
jgi:cytosine/adenosine deaminase-related metal-dependent hydrolase